ncbi:unnamed protein product [Cylicocyclus nassatus]|uniref:Uncharacterized protein n=1 Tax=Cylicocyclus nassatus TaxID=53992 RepID=A0AA36DLK2_CYLNA|nr:unnamed protein product [Cylicocyclus nassatus]
MAESFNQIFNCIKCSYTIDVQNRANKSLGIVENQPIDIHRINEAMANLHPLKDHEDCELSVQEDVVRLIRVIAIIMGNQVDTLHSPKPPRQNEHVHGWFGRDDCEINNENLTQFIGEKKEGKEKRTVDLKEIHNSLRRTGPKTPEEFFANLMTMLLVQVRPS